MNSAVLKYTNIAGTHDGKFQGSSTTVQEDIVAMVSAGVIKRKRAPTPEPSKGRPSGSSEARDKKLPPFAKHFKSSNDTNATPYKVGDTKSWNNETWYFCDCPLHRNRLKWHTHAADTCRTRLNWIATGRPSGPGIANPAEIVDTDDASTAPSSLTSPAPTVTPPVSADITALLASALTLVGDNDLVKDLIADALNAAHDL